MSLDDRSGRIEVSLFDEVLQRYRALIVKDALVLVEGLLRFDEFSDGWRLTARRITDLDEALAAQARRIVVKWPAALVPAAFEELSQILKRYRPGPCPVTIEYRAPSASCALTLGTEWNVRPARELLLALEELAGHDGVELRCAPVPPTALDSLADAGRRP
jgi:DNA polymerase-3 subunit alpha